MDSKQKAIEELKKQRELARERLGPEGLKKLEQLAKGLTQVQKAPMSPPGTVPYDKKSAMEAFRLFLENHGDPEEFERRLKEMISKASH